MTEDETWLRDHVEDEEIFALFTDDTDALHAAVRRLIDRLPDDDELESRLTHTLELALDEACDDTDASVWIATVLGEGDCQGAAWILVRCLAESEDEELQEAAGVALLRLGSRAIASLLDSIDDDQLGIDARRAAYEMLGQLGLVEDEILHERLGSFVEDRIEAELAPAPEGGAFAELATLIARLGRRSLLPSLETILAQRFGGAHPALEDAIETLRENEAGVPFVPTVEPWQERYGWLWDDEPEKARVHRPAPPDFAAFFEVPGAQETLEELEDEG